MTFVNDEDQTLSNVDKSTNLSIEAMDSKLSMATFRIIVSWYSMYNVAHYKVCMFARMNVSVASLDVEAKHAK